jgi:NhaA family Na+:H+ antiporter
MNLKGADRVMHLIHPVSAGIAVPVFAFFSAGVFVQDLNFAQLAKSPVALGILFGLVLGKPIGVVGTAWLVSKFTKASLSQGLSWWDVTTVGLLAGVGFTVSLLINELAFKADHHTSSMGTIAVLVSSTLAAIFATIAIQFRNRAYSR